MGNGYKNQLHPHQRSGFFPMLCTASIKDVTLSHFKPPSSYSSSSSSSSSSSTLSNDPSSPKVSCIGQVKRNNKVIGFPTPYRLISGRSSSSASAAAAANYTKLNKFFSSKNLIAASANGNSTATPCGGREIRNRGGSRKVLEPRNGGDEVNIEELDPPLPVIKKVGREEINLWKRRSGGNATGGLQIQHIHLPNHNNSVPPPTL